MMMTTSIIDVVRERRRKTHISLLETGLRLAEEHNTWMRTTPPKEVGRIFRQFGEPMPEPVCTDDLKRRIEKLKRAYLPDANVAG